MALAVGTWCGELCLAVVLGMASGCAGLSALSAGQVGCSEHIINISDDSGIGPVRTWTAECNGRRYYCTSATNGQTLIGMVSCKESQDGPASSGASGSANQNGGVPATVGCQYDAQCKGARICESGRCVEPATQGPAKGSTCKRGDSVSCQVQCESGSGSSCFNLAKMYEDGDGVAKDSAKMVQYYKLACEKGDTSGCTNLGNKYERGIDVPADPQQAVPLYLRACGLGSSYGCFALGGLYENGKGVAADRARAAELYDKGCKGGNSDACAGRERLK